MHIITLQPGGRTFEARENETVLNAALRQGVILPYSCRNGSCASCKGRLLEGEVRYPYQPPVGLDPEDIPAGNALLCQAVAASDLTIGARPLEQVADIPVKLLPVRVQKIAPLSPQVMRLVLKKPKARRLQYLAGQYVDILLPGGRRRAFSIASPPSREDHLELHVKHVPGGDFTEHVFEGMKAGEILRLEGPLGTFFVRGGSDRPMIMVAGGTGFAPLKAMLETLLEHGDPRQIRLYWGARNAGELYMHERAREWERRHRHLEFVPVLAEPDAGWRGRTGLVHEAVLHDHPSLAAFDVYMSGPPAMIDAGRHGFIAAGLPDDRLFYDSFDFAPKMLR